MNITTLTVVVDGNAFTSVHLTTDAAWEQARTNYALEVDAGDVEAIKESMEGQGILYDVENHDLGPLTVLASGNPFDGMRITGPFSGEDRPITEYAEQYEDDTNWWIVDLAAPEKEN